jgi:hypothetical protein
MCQNARSNHQELQSNVCSLRATYMQICQVRLDTSPMQNYINLSPRLHCRLAVLQMSQFCDERGELPRSVQRYVCQNHHLIHIFRILVLLLSSSSYKITDALTHKFNSPFHNYSHAFLLYKSMSDVTFWQLYVLRLISLGHIGMEMTGSFRKVCEVPIKGSTNLNPRS